MTVKMLGCIAGGLVFCSSVTALTADSAMPYRGIVDRNVFGLTPPPPPPDPELTKPPPPKILLTGITDILGMKQALMKTPPAAAKPGEKAQAEESYILTVGERQGDIEVLDIDETAGTVKVNNGGKVYTLSLEKDGQKPQAGGGAPPALPGTVPPPTGFGAPGGPHGFPPPAPGTAHFNFPMRPTRTSTPGVTSAGGYTPSASGFGAPAMGGFGAPLAANTPGVQVAPGFGSTPTTPLPGAQQQQVPVLSPEQQIVMMEAQREAHANDPNFPPLPPTPLNPNPTGSMPPSPTGGATALPVPTGPPAPPMPVGYGAPPRPR